MFCRFSRGFVCFGDCVFVLYYLFLLVFLCVLLYVIKECVCACVSGFAFPRKQPSDTHSAHRIGALCVYVYVCVCMGDVCSKPSFPEAVFCSSLNHSYLLPFIRPCCLPPSLLASLTFSPIPLIGELPQCRRGIYLHHNLLL